MNDASISLGFVDIRKDLVAQLLWNGEEGRSGLRGCGGDCGRRDRGKGDRGVEGGVGSCDLLVE